MARAPLFALGAAFLLLLQSGPTPAQVPPEVQGVTFENRTTLSWSAVSEALSYNVYRASVSELSLMDYRCYRAGILTTFTEIGENEEGYTYVVTVVTAEGESTLGEDSSGTPRPNNNPCP